MDITEIPRRILVNQINASVESSDEDKERIRLEDLHGEVYNTTQMATKFEVLSFAAPFCIVRERATGKRGTITFQHSPRFYFDFVEDK
jgi:hypothetical protein